MFILESMTKVRVLDVRTLARKDRKPDETPGAQLLMSALLPVETLAMLDGFLPGMLYRKATTSPQGKLEGMEGVEPTEVGQHVKRLPWVYEQTGCTMTVDYGRGGSSNIVLEDCKVHRVSLQPQPTGVLWQWTVDAPALSTSTRGKLSDLKATDIQTTLSGPEVEDDDLADQASRPQLTPAQLRAANAAGKTPEQALAESLGKTMPDPVKEWPFPVEPSGSGGQGNSSAPAAVAKKTAAKPAKKGAKPPAKYRDPNTGLTWSGRGLKPKWLSTALANGKQLADFATQ